MFIQKTSCILAYSVNCLLKSIQILLNFIPKDRECIRKKKCFRANEKIVSKMEKLDKF